MQSGRIGLGLVMVLAGPARAECLGSCYDGLVTAFLSLVVYVLIGVVLLVMLARRKWRRAGLRGLALVVALAVGVPLVSQVWQRVQL
ncbi:hypothetical protein [Tabrizicola sp.]|uniref:hypothetical protein n=1 Tax=Tabrizicola sp. TaxID=2005166 RepID=UPI002735A692|nr:hypothetical protein [Tabrizicola sp.]MDP3194688.1 hypothetical protein [Tabrizicola sp.]